MQKASSVTSATCANWKRKQVVNSVLELDVLLKTGSPTFHTQPDIDSYNIEYFLIHPFKTFCIEKITHFNVRWY